MATYKQINYIKTMLMDAPRSTKIEFEDKGPLFNKDTPNDITQHWINRLEKETGVKKEA